jgi:ATPase subunit of ABC transporter with duplicated ATPase domains
MITVRGVDVRVGAHLLLSDLSFHVSPGDRIGLVGRNGAGKTTLMKILAGEERPAAGCVAATGSIGYLPQDPRAADPGYQGHRPDPLRPRLGPGGPRAVRS